MMHLKRATMITILMMSVSVSVMADSGHSKEEIKTGTATQMPMASEQMPMKGDQPGTMPMMGGNMGNMPMMQMMQKRHAMMQAHMLKMETHMANIEALLGQLVELQKKQ